MYFSMHATQRKCNLEEEEEEEEEEEIGFIYEENHKFSADDKM